MFIRNGRHGYGVVSKVLHWLTVLAIVGQFAVGLTMSDDVYDAEEARIDQLEEVGEEEAERHGEAAEKDFEDRIDRMEDELDARADDYVGDAFQSVLSGRFIADGISLPELHVLIGLSILTLAVLRTVWRWTTPLPPWAEHLGPGERRLESLLEKALLAMLFVVPLTGLVLVAGDTDWLPIHIAAQLVLIAVIAVHVGLVLKHTVVQRNRHIARML